jgi:dihydroorotate dehydrogenase
VLARAMAEAGASWIEANLAEPWVAATFSPLESLDALRELLARVVDASSVPVAVKLPERFELSYRSVVDAFAAAGVRIVVIRNDFAGFEKFHLEAGRRFDLITLGGIRSGYDVRRALSKGARAVQIRTALLEEGPAVFARLEREMRPARDRGPTDVADG